MLACWTLKSIKSPQLQGNFENENVKWEINDQTRPEIELNTMQGLFFSW